MTAHALGRTVRVLNAADAITTLGVAALVGPLEGNPLMAWLLGVHPCLFAFVKVTGVALCTVVLAERGQRALLAIAAGVLVMAVAMNVAILWKVIG